jgi:hypothetical protein
LLKNKKRFKYGNRNRNNNSNKVHNKVIHKQDHNKIHNKLQAILPNHILSLRPNPILVPIIS